MPNTCFPKASYIGLNMALLISTLQSPPAQALPAVDLTCYAVDHAAQVIDLTALCRSRRGAIEPPPQAEDDTGTGDLSYSQQMKRAGLRRWTKGRFDNVGFEAWTTRGEGFYYFLWGVPNPEDHTSPEVVVFFDSNVSRVNKSFVLGCYFSSGTYCTGNTLLIASYSEEDVESLVEDLNRLPAHIRRTGPCDMQCLSGMR